MEISQYPTVINLYKPPGPTSHDMVDLVRRATGERTVGHAGTLDPFAEGVLLILVGREATKRQAEFMHMPKTYVTTFHLGATSDTNDCMGAIQFSDYSLQITEMQIQKILKEFIGEIEQVPPIYSAIKLKGKKAYELARAGKTPELKPRTVHIEHIKILRYEWPKLELEIDCGSGTYIRSLARDIGEKLECGAYVEKLSRTRIGEYRIEDSLMPDTIDNKIL